MSGVGRVRNDFRLFSSFIRLFSIFIRRGRLGNFAVCADAPAHVWRRIDIRRLESDGIADTERLIRNLEGRDFLASPHLAEPLKVFSFNSRRSPP